MAIGKFNLLRKLKEAYWEKWYSYVSKTDKGNELTFMNYGYQGDKDLPLLQHQEKNRFQIQLYDKTLSSIPSDPRKASVLEVGCGRGGGLTYLAEQYPDASFLGLDLCQAAVDSCNSSNKRENLRFAWGDARALGLSQGLFDAIINIESSHRYPDMPRFLKEVRRVLKPNGYFSIVDFRATDKIPELKHQLRSSGMQVLEEEDITPNVLRAMDLDDPRKLDLIKRLVPRPLHFPAREFASVVGSQSYRSLLNGQRQYLRFLLKKSKS